MSNYVITADSLPDYDDWGPDSYWSAADWVTWHKALKAKYGPGEANRFFLNAYNNSGFGGTEWDYRTTDTPFRNYAKENNFYEGLFTGVGGLIGRVISFGSDLLEGGSSITQGVSQTAKEVPETVSSLLSVIRIVLILAIVLGAGYFFFTYVMKGKIPKWK